jgi:hypothetical protein
MTDETTEKTETGIHAKPVSLNAQIIAAIWIALWSGAGFVSKMVHGLDIPIWEIVTSGLSIAACFSAVYFNLVMDKIKDWKLGAQA